VATKKRASNRKKSPRRQDAIALLKADHEKVQTMFSQFERARGTDRKEALARQICRELVIHTQIEEEIFYPAVRNSLPKSEDLLDEAEVEHASAKQLIAQIEAGGADGKWEAKVTVLGEYVRHHVEEEQNELFPKVRKSRIDLADLGEQLLARKQELAEGAKDSKQGVLERMAKTARSLVASAS
jgi:hemerythrin-like domain-containing protein